ncbi:MAG: ATP-binding protein [bacterium]|nr:ATP-binding protein [bacterium]
MDLLQQHGSFFLQSLFLHLDVYAFIVNTKNQLLWANQKFLDFIEQKEDGYQGQDILQLAPLIAQNKLEKKFKSCLSTNKYASDETVLYWDNKIMIINLKMFRYTVGKTDTNHLLVVIENITKLYDLIKDIKNTELFIDNLLSSIRTYSIIITDNNFNIKKFNKGSEILFEYESHEVENKMNINDFFPEKTLFRFQEILESLKILNIIRRELELKNKNKNVFIADLTVSKMLDAKNVHSGYIFIATDMTEHKKLKGDIEKSNIELARLYQETQKANKAKSIFLANISHEFRTPLTAILGFSELLMDQKVGILNQTQKEFLSDIWNSGKHLLNLINDILDMSKIEAEKIELNMEKICLQDIINTAKTFVLPMVKDKKLNLKDHIPDKKIYIRVDELRMKQILYNLYSNAFKFTPDNGVIITDVKLTEESVLIAIQDSGIGIKPEDQALLFEEFVQIQNPYSKKYQGTGLGLTLVKKFLQMMNGNISAYSQGEGKGTTFTITMPFEKE